MVDRTEEDILQDRKIADLEEKIKNLETKVDDFADFSIEVRQKFEVFEPLEGFVKHLHSWLHR